MDQKKILATLDRVDDLPTLPSVAMEVNAMLQDYDTPMEKLVQTIEKDQAMVPKILKLVNSAFYGLPSRISDISRAVSILGFNTVRNAVVTLSIIEAFSEKGPGRGFDIKRFWSHSLGVAVTSKYLAKKTEFHSPEEAFTGGLLHDTGKVVLYRYFKDLFEKVVRSVGENGLTFYDAEKRELPVTHAMIGSYLAEKWQLPAALVDVIRYHHELATDVADFEMLQIVHAADVIINQYDGDPDHNVRPSDMDAGPDRKIGEMFQLAPEWFPDVLDEIHVACGSFLEE